MIFSIFALIIVVALFIYPVRDHSGDAIRLFRKWICLFVMVLCACIIISVSTPYRIVYETGGTLTPNKIIVTPTNYIITYKKNLVQYTKEFPVVRTEIITDKDTPYCRNWIVSKPGWAGLFVPYFPKESYEISTNDQTEIVYIGRE